jgi:hypothetical protein
MLNLTKGDKGIWEKSLLVRHAQAAEELRSYSPRVLSLISPSKNVMNYATATRDC